MEAQENKVNRKTGCNLICPICGKSFYRKKSEINNMKDKNNATCSKECSYELKKTLYSGKNNHQYGLTGNKNASWKSDIKYSKNDNHYTMIRVEDHPFRDKSNFVPKYRLVAEQHLLNENNSIEINGKLYLKPECVVHHIDFNKKNDDASNLYVFPNSSQHVIFHNAYRAGKVKNLDEFKTYYKFVYIDRLYNFQWLYMAYVYYDLSINQISQLLDMPYKAIESQIINKQLDIIKKEMGHKKKRLEFIKKKLLSNSFVNPFEVKIEEITYEELQNIASERGTGKLGSSNK